VNSRLLVVAGCALVDDPIQGRLEPDTALLVDDGIIAEIGPAARLIERYPELPREGGHDLLALPGLVNAHHHGRGVTWLQQGHPDEPLEEWLLGFRLAHTVEPELDARYAAERLLRSGVTTVIISHYQPASPELADAVHAMVSGLLGTGLRVVFAVGFLDRSAWKDPEFRAGLPPSLESSVAERVGPAGRSPWPEAAFDLFDDLRRHVDADPHIRLLPAFGPVAPHWCSDDLLRAVAERSKQTDAPLHMHALETRHQQHLALARTGQPELERVADLGVLTPRTSIAHALWLEPDDVAAVLGCGTTLVHNPSSNMRLGSGHLELTSLLDDGVRVALGTDCAGLRDDDDLLQEVGLAAIARRSPDTRWLKPTEALTLATTAGARAAGLGGQTGALLRGYRADVVLIDAAALAAPAALNWANALDLVLGRATTRHVRTVLVDGEVVVRDGQTTRTDSQQTAALLAEAHRHVHPMPVDAALIEEIKPSLRSHIAQVEAAAKRKRAFA
jgi:cytosine/adenosine deaminase-related metal-dependent hydrolase